MRRLAGERGVMDQDDPDKAFFSERGEDGSEALELGGSETAVGVKERSRDGRVQSDHGDMAQSADERKRAGSVKRIARHVGLPVPDADTGTHLDVDIVIARYGGDAMRRAEVCEPAGGGPMLGRQAEIDEIAGDSDMVGRLGSQIVDDRSQGRGQMLVAPAMAPVDHAEQAFGMNVGNMAARQRQVDIGQVGERETIIHVEPVGASCRRMPVTGMWSGYRLAGLAMPRPGMQRGVCELLRAMGRGGSTERAMKRERILRGALQKYWRWQRALTVGARGMVIDEAGRLLLVRHTYTPGWTFPGGGVEFGETIVESLRRELLEEANVTVTGAPTLFGIYSNANAFPGDHVAVYLVREWEQSSVPAPNREIAEIGFFAADRLPADTTAGTRRRVAEFRGEAQARETW